MFGGGGEPERVEAAYADFGGACETGCGAEHAVEGHGGA